MKDQNRYIKSNNCSIVKRAHGKWSQLLVILVLLLSFSSCREFLDIETPTSKVVTVAVFESEESAIAAALGMYHQMMHVNGFANGNFNSVTLLCGLSADEFGLYTNDVDYTGFSRNEVITSSAKNYSVWSTAYETIYRANALLAGLEESTISENIKRQLQGEGKFVRAFAHFCLVNLYGDIPIVTTIDFRVNAIGTRKSKELVYDQIIRDLLDAKELLSSDYPSKGRVRPNKSVATAMLARAYLYLGDWGNAEVQATEVIENSNYQILTDFNGIFLDGSKEAIWQMIYPASPQTTLEGTLFILLSAPNPSHPVAITDDLYNAFESGDERLTKWVGDFTNDAATFHFSYKYKNSQGSELVTTEYSMVLRFAEQYLIRAESRAHLENLPGAIEDLDVIRSRANLLAIHDTNPSIDQESLLLAIEHERRVELFSEWGHRWFDLKRTNHANTILGAKKDNWQSTDELFPIPDQEMLIAPNLTPQNPGY